jgi:hypothetical protein
VYAIMKGCQATGDVVATSERLLFVSQVEFHKVRLAFRRVLPSPSISLPLIPRSSRSWLDK